MPAAKPIMAAQDPKLHGPHATCTNEAPKQVINESANLPSTHTRHTLEDKSTQTITNCIISTELRYITVHFSNSFASFHPVLPRLRVHLNMFRDSNFRGPVENHAIMIQLF